MLRIFILISSCTFLLLNSGIAQTGDIRGRVVDAAETPVPGATILIDSTSYGTAADDEGYFEMAQIPAGDLIITASSIGFKTQSKSLKLRDGQNLYIEFIMVESDIVLNEVSITASRDYNNVKRMKEVEGTLIFSGKRNDVVILDKTNANTAENIPRQVFSKVPGVYEWDLDGSGVQTSISVRGLNPHRSWEFNVRQNRYSVNSDVFGYPESHYNPPTEALSKIELIRGGACLQYGPQYGGMLNYVIKEGPTDKKIDFESRQSFGSNYMFNTFNSIGGQIGKLNYYAYINYRGSDGFRPNSRYDFLSGFAGLHYVFSDRLKMGLEFSKMYYVDQLAGGLTDAQFEQDPYQSTRSRNYFQPNHNIPALTFNYTLNTNALLSLKSNMIIGQRNSVMFIAPPTVNDSISTVTNEYQPRTVDRDFYNSLTNELRYLQYYQIGGRKHVLSAGLRYSISETTRKQGGEGTTGTDFDLTLVSPYSLDLTFRTVNYALCAENLFHVGEKFSVTPGFRYEIIQTNMTGEIESASAPFDYNKNRNIPLFGIGMQFNIDQQNNLYANCTQAYRPILYSDITPVGSLDVIDPDMEDSKGFNSDLGIRGSIKDVFTYDIGIFYLQYGNRIGSLALVDDEGQTYLYKTNVGTSAATGVESFMEFRPTELSEQLSRYGQLGIFVTATFDHAEYIDAITSANGQEVQLKGNQLENAPEWIVRSGISYNYQFISSTLQGSYVSSIYSDALNTESSVSGVTGIVPSYFIVDWNTTIRIHNYNLKAGINNLNDAIYFTRRINNYPGPGILPADGRTFYISVGKEF